MSSSSVQETTSVLDAKVAFRLGGTSLAALTVLECGEPRSAVEVSLACGLSVKTVYHASSSRIHWFLRISSCWNRIPKGFRGGRHIAALFSYSKKDSIRKSRLGGFPQAGNSP